MIAWITETLAAATALMALVLLLRPAASRLFGARIAYALWLLPAIRMALPPLPGWRTLFVPRMLVELPRPEMAGRFELALANPSLPGPDLVLPVIAPAAGPAPWRPLLEYGLVGAWLIGAALLLGWQLWRYRSFLDRALAGATPLGRAAGTELLLSDAVPGPLATGILRRRILLPRDFTTRYDRTSQRLVLDHEAAHHDRLDLVANLAALGMLALHWWNPLAWIAHHAFRADQELACDASVLARADPAERYTYAQAVARSGGFHMPMAVAPLAPAARLKRRLRMMGRKSSRMQGALGALIVTGVIGTGLLTSASGSATQIMVGDQMPEPPAPPAPPLVRPIPPVPPAPPVRAIRIGVRASALVAPPPPAALPAPPAPPAPPTPDLALRAADEAVSAARGEADAARIAAEQARQAIRAIDVGRLVRTALAEARETIARACGPAWACEGVDARPEVARALRSTRDELAADGDLPDAVRAQVVAELDAELARTEAERR